MLSLKILAGINTVKNRELWKSWQDGKMYMQTVRGKLFLLTIFFLFLIILLAVFFYSGLRKKLVENAETVMRIKTITTAEVIEKRNLEAVTIAQIMAITQKNGMFGQRENSVNYSKEILSSYPEITGAYFGYEPDSDGKDSLFSSNYSRYSNYINKTGRFLPYWYRDKERIKLTPLIDMETSLYYEECRKRFLESGKEEHIITEPYFYQGKMIVEQTYPIIIENEFKGIAGVDRALNNLFHYKDFEIPYKSSGFILISSRGNILFSDVNLSSEGNFRKAMQTRYKQDKPELDSKMLTFHISETDSHIILKKFHEMDTRYLGPLKIPDPVSNSKRYFYYAAAKIPTGNWTVVMRASEYEILHPVYRSLYMISAFSIFFVLVINFMAFRIGRQITDPIDTIIKNASEFEKGNYDFKETSSAVVELDLMVRSFYRTAEQRRIAEKKLADTRDNLQKTVNRQYDLLKESEDRYRKLFDNANDAILVIKDGKYTECNRKTLSMFDCGRSDIIGKMPGDLSPEIQPDGSKSAEKAERLINETIEGKSQFFEWQHKKTDGSVFDTDISLYRIKSENNFYVITMIRDISKRKAAETERDATIDELTDALENIKTLSGLVPICSHCKKIRDDEGYWNRN